MSRGEKVFWWVLIVGALTAPAWGEEPVARLAGRAGTMCEEGERYEAVRIGRSWKALCYRGMDLEEARLEVGADLRLPNSESRSGGCMTCPGTRELLEVEMYLYYRDLNWHRGWYYGAGRWTHGRRGKRRAAPPPQP